MKGLWIFLALLLVAALFWWMKKRAAQKELDDQAAAELLKQADIKLDTSGAANTSGKTKTTSQSKPKKKKVVAGTPVVVAPLKIGDTMYVLSEGANAYAEPKATASGILQYYPKGSFIGTYLNQTGIFTKILQTSTLYGMEDTRVVYFRSSDIYRKTQNQ